MKSRRKKFFAVIGITATLAGVSALCSSCLFMVYNLEMNRRASYAYTLNEDGKSYTVTHVPEEAEEIEIPETYKNLPVTGIARNACSGGIPLMMSDYNGISAKKFTFSSNIQSFEANAFEGTDSIEEVYFNGTMKDWLSISFGGECANPMSGSEDGGVKLYVGRELVTSVYFSDEYESTPRYAFESCQTLTEIGFADTVKEIEAGSFKNCNGLTSVDLQNVKTVGKSAFEECGKLTKITGDSVTSVGARAFYGDKELTEAPFTDSVVTVGDYAFYDCDGFSDLTFGNSLQSVGVYAFSECDGLTGLVFGDSLQSVGAYAFYNCHGLRRADLGDGRKRINRNAFDSCWNLLEIQLGDVTEIEKQAFMECYGLNTVTIPQSLKSCASDAFENCKNLMEAVNYSSVQMNVKELTDPAESKLAYVDGFVFYGEEPILIGYIGEEKDWVLPVLDTEYKVKDWAFYGRQVDSIVFSESVTEIGEGAFQNSTLKKADMGGSNIEKIMERAFLDCKKLEEVSLPNGLKSIGAIAFFRCAATEITVPESVEVLGENVFDKGVAVYEHSKWLVTYIKVEGGGWVYPQEAFDLSNPQDLERFNSIFPYKMEKIEK